MARSALVDIMAQAAFRAGRILIRDFGEVENLQVSQKGPNDFVCSTDHRAEKIIREHLTKARPTYGSLFEESAETIGQDTGNRWIVDALDGTKNFLHGIPLFCTSIALEREGSVVAGVIYNPVADELFSAERGKGAFLNDRRIRISGRRHFENALTSVGSLSGKSSADKAKELKNLLLLLTTASGVRQCGATALDIAWLAAGRFDLFLRYGACIWDIAAGALLVREAGGVISGSDRAEDASGMIKSGCILAGNPSLYAQLYKKLVF